MTVTDRAFVVLCFAAVPIGRLVADEPPYPVSSMIRKITWHWETHRTAAPGSDLWPVTWGPDGNLYAAWGDGGGFGGTNSDGRVSMGFARIEGPPEQYQGININGGKNSEHPAAFPKTGKTGGILFVDGTLYARLNLQNGKWPGVDHSLAWSDDSGATWQQTSWVFPKGVGNFKPARFLNFGKDYARVPDALAGFVYIYGFREGKGNIGNSIYLLRVPEKSMRERDQYEFFAGLDDGRPTWSSNVGKIEPVFTDANGVVPTTGAVYHPALKRFLLTSFHTGPGQLGIFEGPQPWGPWRTVAYYEDWGKMGVDGHGLNCDFPAKWMSEDGRTMWCIFSVYGPGAQKGIQGHDRFNLVKASLTLSEE